MIPVKFMFSMKATKIDGIFTVDLTYVVSVKSTMKISSIFVAFLKNTNFKELDSKALLSVCFFFVVVVRH